MNERLELFFWFLISFEGISVCSADSYTFIENIYISAEFIVIHLVKSAFVSVSLEDKVKCVFIGEQWELIKNS